MDRDLLEAIRLVVREEIGAAKDGELLDPDELAERLKVPVSWVYENSRLGKIPTVRVGKYVRFRLTEVLTKGGKNGKD